MQPVASSDSIDCACHIMAAAVLSTAVNRNACQVPALALRLSKGVLQSGEVF